MEIRVVLADDHVIVRQGLVSLLEREADIQVVGQASDGLELVNLVRQLKPDVAVTDITMPGLSGFEAIHRILAVKHKPKIVCLSVHGDLRLVREVMDKGVSAYLVKGCAYHELVQAVRSAIDGQIYLSSEVASAATHHCGVDDEVAGMPLHMLLTSREREIVQLFAEGRSTHQIAERLHISKKTVASHREHIMDKLHIAGIAELTRFAIREGLCSMCTPCPSLQPSCKTSASPCNTPDDHRIP